MTVGVRTSLLIGENRGESESPEAKQSDLGRRVREEGRVRGRRAREDRGRSERERVSGLCYSNPLPALKCGHHVDLLKKCGPYVRPANQWRGGGAVRIRHSEREETREQMQPHLQQDWTLCRPREQASDELERGAALTVTAAGRTVSAPLSRGSTHVGPKELGFLFEFQLHRSMMQ